MVWRGGGGNIDEYMNWDLEWVVIRAMPLSTPIGFLQEGQAMERDNE